MGEACPMKSMPLANNFGIPTMGYRRKFRNRDRLFHVPYDLIEHQDNWNEILLRELARIIGKMQGLLHRVGN
jgi:hypothetical protein